MRSEDPLFLNEELDLKPEYKTYTDTGCDLYPSCLNCPLDICAYEQPGGISRVKKSQRNKRIAAKARKGKTAKEIASIFHISVRSVQRILQYHRFEYDGIKEGESNV